MRSKDWQFQDLEQMITTNIPIIRGLDVKLYNRNYNIHV